MEKNTDVVEKKLGIAFGALAPTIADQLKAQDFKFSPTIVKDFERYRHSILTLRFADLMNQKMSEIVIKKLFSKIRAHVAKVNKLKVADIA